MPWAGSSGMLNGNVLSAAAAQPLPPYCFYLSVAEVRKGFCVSLIYSLGCMFVHVSVKKNKQSTTINLSFHKSCELQPLTKGSCYLSNSCATAGMKEQQSCRHCWVLALQKCSAARCIFKHSCLGNWNPSSRRGGVYILFLLYWVWNL